jgi:hypothetical protein
LYLSKCPETTEGPGYLAGFVDNIGDELAFKKIKSGLITVLHRSVVRSAAQYEPKFCFEK